MIRFPFPNPDSHIYHLLIARDEPNLKIFYIVSNIAEMWKVDASTKAVKLEKVETPVLENVEVKKCEMSPNR